MGIEVAVGAVLAGVASGTAITATGITLGFSFAAAATSFALGALQSALAPKPKKSRNLSSNLSIKSEGITQNVRQAITSRRILYGEARVGGALVFIETTNNDQDLHMVLVVADHECAELGEIWADDISIPQDYIDGGGNVTSGAYSGKMRIKKLLGGAGQVADADLVSETSVTSAFVGNGITYLYLKLIYDRDVYPSKIPTFTVFARGAKAYDVRDASTNFQANLPLLVYDYLRRDLDGLTPGVGVAAADIDTTSLTASANAADEFVTTTAINDVVTSIDAAGNTISSNGVNSRSQFQRGDRVQITSTGSLPGNVAAVTNYYIIPFQRLANAGHTVRYRLASTLANAMAGTVHDITSAGSGTITVTKNAEPRYYGGGIIETSDEPRANIEAMLSGCGGSLVYLGGKWHIQAAFYSTPVFTFDETHIIDKLVMRPKISRRDRFNLVKGVYVSPLNDGEASDYPSVKNSTYITQDNNRTLPIDHDLDMTQRPHTAMRLAKIKLEKSRQEIFVDGKFNLSAMQVQPGDTIYLSNARFGWSSKEFEVLKWGLNNKLVNKVPLFFVEMSLQETASAVYDWNNGEETAVDPAPNTNLPNPLSVNPPTGLAVVPVETATAGGDLTYEFVISWTPPVDIFVLNGGWYEVQFKRSSDSDWSRSFRAEDDDTSVRVNQVQPGINYDTRMRAVNDLGVRSSYQSLFGFTVSSPSGATIKQDYGLITGSVIDSIDYGAITDAVVDSNDFGSIV